MSYRGTECPVDGCGSRVAPRKLLLLCNDNVVMKMPMCAYHRDLLLAASDSFVKIKLSREVQSGK